MDAVDPGAVYHMATSSTGPGHIIKFFTNFKFTTKVQAPSNNVLGPGQFWSKMCQRFSTILPKLLLGEWLGEWYSTSYIYDIDHGPPVVIRVDGSASVAILNFSDNQGTVVIDLDISKCWFEG